MTEWQKCTDSDDMEREITYDLFQDFVITKALINVSVSQVHPFYTRKSISFLSGIECLLLMIDLFSLIERTI